MSNNAVSTGALHLGGNTKKFFQSISTGEDKSKGPQQPQQPPKKQGEGFLKKIVKAVTEFSNSGETTTKANPLDTEEQSIAQDNFVSTPGAATDVIVQPTAAEMTAKDNEMYALLLKDGYPVEGDLEESPEQKQEIDDETFDPASQTGKFLILLEHSFRLPMVRFLRRQLYLPREQRLLLKKLGRSYSQKMISILDGNESTNWEVFIKQLPKASADSLLKFLNFENEDLLHAISKNNQFEVDKRFVGDTMDFLRSNCKSLKTFTEIDALVHLVNNKGQAYFKNVDIEQEARMNFPTPWVNEVHKFASPIALKDIQPCMIERQEILNMDEAEIRFELIMDAARIITRLLLSVDVRLDLLKQFQPVLDNFISYTQRLQINKRANSMQSQALEIKENFYEVPLDMFTPITKDEVASVPQLPIADSSDNVPQEIPDNANTQAAEKEESSVIENEIVINTVSDSVTNEKQTPPTVRTLTVAQEELAKKHNLSVNSSKESLQFKSGDNELIKDLKMTLALMQRNQQESAS